MVGQAVGVVGLVMVWAFTNQNDWILGLAAGTAGSLGIAVHDERLVRQNRIQTAVIWQLISNWTLALTFTIIVPAVLPIFVAMVLLGGVVSLPYLNRGNLRIVLVASSAMAVAITLFGEFEHWTDVTSGMPHWLPGFIVCITLPVLVGYTAVLLWNYRANLLDAF